MVMELFENRSVPIFDIKFEKQFKVNGHRLKPYLTSKPPTQADLRNMHLPEAHEDVMTVSLHLINRHELHKVSSS